MDHVLSSGDRKVRSVQFNERVHSVGGLKTKNGLQWQSGSEQNNEQHHGYSHITGHDSQQQQFNELTETGQQHSQSLELSTSTTDARTGSLTCATSAVTSQATAVTNVTDLTSLSSWSAGQSLQTTAASLCPANVQPARAPCEAASVVEQMISRYHMTSQQQTDDKITFEDGLTHLRNLYETQLVSTRLASLY